MCNRYRNQMAKDRYTDEFNQLKLPLRWAALPNLRPGDYTITDVAPVIRWDGADFVVEMMKWSWPGRKGPVFNYQGEGRDFSGSERVLVPADGFYVYFGDKRPKERLLFTRHGWMFVMPAVVRNGGFAILTVDSDPSFASLHDRAPVTMMLDEGARWLKDPASAPPLRCAGPEDFSVLPA